MIENELRGAWNHRDSQSATVLDKQEQSYTAMDPPEATDLNKAEKRWMQTM